MKLIPAALAVAVTMIIFLAFTVSSAEESSKFITLEELKPGMKGTAYSVFSGTEPESFSVELQSVMEGPVAGSRYMLVRVIDEKLRIGSGFSGTPVYFDGRLAGAISHMEKHLASQMAMVVPISRMLEDGAKAAPSTGVKTASVAAIKPGNMISLPQIRGDFWMGSSGTVTFVGNDLLLAFGHENNFTGDTVQFPIHRATVHGIIPKLDISHKEASPLEEIGSVTWDGKSALVGRLGTKAAMSPFMVDYQNISETGRKFNLEILNHTRLAPMIVTRAVRFILASILPNSPHGTDLDVTMTVTLKGLETPVVINQRMSSEILKTDSPLVSNPLQSLLAALLIPIKEFQSLSAISIKMTDLPDAKTAQIQEAAFTRIKARPGDTVNLRVRLNGPFAEPKDVNVPVKIPVDFDKPRFIVSVHSGKSVRPSETAPVSTQEIAGWLSGIARSDELVILSPGAANGSAYPEARLNRSITRTGWNVEGSAEAAIAVSAGE